MIVSVVIPLPIVRSFSYSVHERLQPFIKRYQRVKVPFQNKVITGFIEDIEDGTTQGLKEVLDIIDIYPLLDEGIVRLCRWSSDYYITPLGIVLKYAIPNYLQLEQYLIVDVQKRGYLEDMGQLEGKTFGETFNLIEKYKIVKYLDDGIISLRDVFTKNKFRYLFEEKDNFKKNNEKTIFIGGIKERIEYYTRTIESHVSEGNNVLMLMPDYEMWGSIFYDLLKERF
ncbi:MAG: hypothetical protein N3D15_07925, partial [Syntrophorhabdaceae bacterium]|nr:hypothetical protein [Syntrophorhabdaceae bacterium]